MTAIISNVDQLSPDEPQAGGDGGAGRSQSDWTGRANTACQQGYQAASRLADARRKFRAAQADLERGRQIRDSVHAAEAAEQEGAEPPSEDRFPTPFQTGELKPLPELELHVADAEIELREAQGEYGKAKSRLSALLSAAQAALGQAQSWAKPAYAGSFAEALDESAQYHQMEAEFLQELVHQLEDALRSMTQAASTGDFAIPSRDQPGARTYPPGLLPEGATPIEGILSPAPPVEALRQHGSPLNEPSAQSPEANPPSPWDDMGPLPGMSRGARP